MPVNLISLKKKVTNLMSIWDFSLLKGLDILNLLSQSYSKFSITDNYAGGTFIIPDTAKICVVVSLKFFFLFGLAGNLSILLIVT